MVEGGRLESVWAATSRGFESLLLRQTISETPEKSGVSLFHALKASGDRSVAPEVFCFGCCSKSNGKRILPLQDEGFALI